MKISVIGTIALTLLAMSAPVSAHDGSGGVSLTPRPSIRALAMGETGLLEAGSGADFAANPATLTWMSGAGATLAHAGLVEGISATVTTACLAAPAGEAVAMPDAGKVGHRFGLGASLDHGGVELSQGTDWGWDLASVGAAYRPAPYASVGLAGKYLFSRSDLEGSGVHAYAVDLGAFLEMAPGFRLAASLRNVVGGVTWEDGEDESPPFAAVLGGGFLLPHGVAGNVAYTYSAGAPGKVGLGVEAPVAATGLGLRGGYIYSSGDYSRNIFTAGFGFAYGGFALDYAVRLDDELALGITHHFSLGYMVP